MPDNAVATRTLADLSTISEALQSSNNRCNEPKEIYVDLQISEMVLVDTMGFSMDETPVLGGSYR